MKNRSLFWTYFFMSAVRYGLLFVLALILTLIGTIWIPVCSYIGLGLMGLYLLICLSSAVRMQRLINSLSDDDAEFGEMMERLAADPQAFLSDAMDDYDEKKQLHGEDLLTLSDEDLFETVYLQNLDIAEGAEDEDRELDQFAGARRTVYILSLFDSEIQNGGLCQFFVNSSRAVAPYVSEALGCVGATAHRALFDRFVTANRIDLGALDSFKIFSRKGYIKQTKRFDFDSFDDAYYDLPALQDNTVAYIKAHIQDF